MSHVLLEGAWPGGAGAGGDRLFEEVTSSRGIGLMVGEEEMRVGAIGRQGQGFLREGGATSRRGDLPRLVHEVLRLVEGASFVSARQSRELGDGASCPRPPYQRRGASS